MARRVFHSFHYQLDSWRVQKVRNMGVIEGQSILTPNQWEDVTRRGDAAIRAWIDREMRGKSCNVVLIGSKTAGRKWITYEIEKAWTDKKGLLGIHIHSHRLADGNGNTTLKGANPFVGIKIADRFGRRLSIDSIVPVYDPPGRTSTAVYNFIKNNIEDWVEHAIDLRGAR